MYENLVNQKVLSNLNYNQSDQEINSLNAALQALAVGDFEQKWAIAKILVKYGDIVIPPLQDVILNEKADLEHRCFGLRILSQLKNPEIVLIVTQLLMSTKEEELISLATQTLAVQGKQSIAFLAKLLAEEEYRLLACKALAQIPSCLVIEPLLSVVEDENSEVKKVAICALRNFNDSRITQVMINALQDYSSEIRKEALTGLGLKLKGNQEKSLIATIIPLLKDINLSVAQQAALALSRCHNPLAVSALESVFESSITPLPLQETIIKALGWMATPESIYCLGKFICLSESSLAVEIIKVLGRVRKLELKEEIINILNRFYHSESSCVQDEKILQHLCYTWTQLKAVEAIPLLKEIETNENEQVSFHAQSAIKQLTINN